MRRVKYPTRAARLRRLRTEVYILRAVIFLLAVVLLVLAGRTGAEAYDSTPAPCDPAGAEIAEPGHMMPAARPETEVAGREEPPRYPLEGAGRDLIERVAEAEAGGEPFAGQAAVCQCILDTAEAEGKTPAEVVLEAGQYAAPAGEASESVKLAVALVFDKGATVTDAPIRWFYNPEKCVSAWHESKEFVIEIGGHRFFA